MKKIGFALQVFGLIVMFPLCVVLEMNHAATNSTAHNTTSGNNQIQEKSTPKLIAKAFATFKSQYLITKIISGTF